MATDLIREEVRDPAPQRLVSQESRGVYQAGSIIALPVLSGLHHHYVRV
jgi:hypothetical protein